MKATRIVGHLAPVALGLVAVTAAATPVPLDTTSALNGITQIYSATFDGALAPCSTPGSPSYCAFFGGYPPASPPATRAIAITPTPTGVVQGVPGGIHPPPVAGSFLDLTLSPDHTQLTIVGGTVKIPDLTLTILGSTFVTAKGAGIAFSSAPQTTSVDANGVAVFTVNTAPAVVVDFSTFTEVVAGNFTGSDGDCIGQLCPLIPVLTLDMIRYRLVIDYDDTFSSFTASYEGQTANNSMLFITMNSNATAPEGITVSDSVAPTSDLLVPFGGIVQLGTATQTVTITNNGDSDFPVGTLAQTDALAPPFALGNDGCSGQTLTPGSSCTTQVTFSPTAIGDFSDSFDIPSLGTIAVSGTGTFKVTDSSGAADDRFVSFFNVDIGSSGQQTVTVTNEGATDLMIGSIGQTNPLAAPFAIDTDNCTGQTIVPSGSCMLTVSFTPGAVASYPDAFDIPSNDPDQVTVTVSVNGDGGMAVEPPTPQGASSGFMALDPATLLALGLTGAAIQRRRRRLH